MRKDNEDEVCIFESSSTSNRKVHIGELIQFLTYVINANDKNKYSLILFPCGNSDTSPNVNDEKERLRYYYDNFPLSKKQKEKIKMIKITDQSKNLNNPDIEKNRGRIKFIGVCICIKIYHPCHI